jgi:hypothetical protein
MRARWVSTIALAACFADEGADGSASAADAGSTAADGSSGGGSSSSASGSSASEGSTGVDGSTGTDGGVDTGSETGPAGTPGDRIGLYIDETGVFNLRNELAPGPADIVLMFGLPMPDTSIPLTGDWDGDGIDTVGGWLLSNSEVFLRNSNSRGPADLQYVSPIVGTVRPIVGDWDGDGVDTLGLYDPNTGHFELMEQHSTDSPRIAVDFGGPGLQPLAGDWDDDGDDSIGVFAEATGTFFLRFTNTNGEADLTSSFGPGGAGVIAIAGDWDGDGRDALGIYTPATGAFELTDSIGGGNATYAFMFGATGGEPVVGHWSD